MASYTEEKRFELILVSPLTGDTDLPPIQRRASMWLDWAIVWRTKAPAFSFVPFVAITGCHTSMRRWITVFKADVETEDVATPIKCFSDVGDL